MQKLSLRIDWGDQDLLGHVNNVSIIRYLQAGRVMFMEKIGLPAFPGMKTGPIEAATQIQFRKQLFFPGHVAMYIGNDRFCHATARAGSDGFTINSLNPEDGDYREDLHRSITKVGSYF